MGPTVAAFRRNQSSMYEISRLEEQINAARVLLKDLDVRLGIESNHLWIQDQDLDDTEDGKDEVVPSMEELIGKYLQLLPITVIWSDGGSSEVFINGFTPKFWLEWVQALTITSFGNPYQQRTACSKY